MAKLPGKKRGTPSRQALYQMTAGHAREAILCLMDIIRNGDNSAARMGAAKVILNKCLPDLRATSITGAEGKELVLQILGGSTTNAVSSDNSHPQAPQLKEEN